MNSTPHQGQNFTSSRNSSKYVHISTFQPNQPANHLLSQSPKLRNQISEPEQNPIVLPSNPSDDDTTSTNLLPATTDTTDSKDSSKGFSLANLMKYVNIDEVKGVVDRLGGLDNILATVTKVQKVVSTVGQMAPMVKLFTGLGKNKSSGESTSSPSAGTPRRRTSQRPTRRSSSSKSRPSQSINRKRTSSTQSKRRPSQSTGKKRRATGSR